MKILLNNDTIMEQAHKTYESFTANDELLEVYEARSKRLHDEATRLSDAREEGLQKGKLEGKLEGNLEGKKEGIYETASRMKKIGVSINIICKSTGLTEDEILGL